MNIPQDISFSNSHILQLRVEPYAIFLSMDFVLSPSHSSFQPPQPKEWACFRKGILGISGFKHLTWDAKGTPPARDAAGELDWGCLDEFTHTNNGWHLAGDWGIIEIIGGDLNIELDPI
jgi:hypothetical protein